MNHPERLGKYQITGVLGEGAMGVVYRGFDPDIRRVVALKTIRTQLSEGPQGAAQIAARFRNEAQAAGRLLHPGIVGVYDFGDDGRVAYIAMEYVEGHTLSHYLSHRVRFSEADVASIATQLLEALAHAHEHGVWHRDIKPSNIIMTRTGRVKIADFGIARTDTSGLTMANSVLGTPMYMAPEQFLGRQVDHRVDVYSTGVVLYQLVAGRAPFHGPHEALMYKVVNEAPVPPSTLEGAMHGPRFDAVVAAALAKDPAARFANAGVFREAVAAALGQPVPGAVAPEAVFALPTANDYAPTERIATPPAPGAIGAAVPMPAGPGAVPSQPPTHPPTAPPTHWDPSVLAQVEAQLARHVGPMAAVMVRRTAKGCSDLATLQARLAEQITSAAAREAFLGMASRSGTGGTGSGGLTARLGLGAGTGSGGTGWMGGSAPRTAGGAAGAPGAAAADARPVDEALLLQAVRVLAPHVGPIAKVLVKRAAERTRQREAFFALLVDASPEPVRARLLAELQQLT